MEIREAIMTRKSIRGFKDTPVSKETIADILNTASRSVSALNSQPWRCIVLAGDIKDKIGEANVQAFLSGAEEDVKDPVMQGEGRKRMIGVAKQLFAAMDIQREDKEKRLWWSQRGFRFFDAPAVVLICIDKEFDSEFHRLDIGAFMQNFTLAAMDYGLGTCVELQAVTYLGGVREYLDVDPDAEFVVGIALGYPDDDFPANHVVSERADMAGLTEWYGFED